MAHTDLGIYLHDHGHAEEAIEKLSPGHPDQSEYPEALNDLGNALAAQGRLDEAIENFRKAIQLNPDYREALE